MGLYGGKGYVYLGDGVFVVVLLLQFMIEYMFPENNCICE